jgi:putative oxidoreductase
MTVRSATSPGLSPLRRMIEAANRIIASVPVSLVTLLARLSLATVFWRSGRTKVEEGTLLTLSDNALWLFREEYKLPLLPPELAAYLALLGEHLFPVLLLIGFGSRFAALGLLLMTLVIQVFVYPDAYPVHGPWAVCCLVVMLHGGGWISLDHWLARAMRP